MPSRVAILTGTLAGRSFPIEKNAFRIGSGKQCDISLPDDGIPEHALTVRYSDGRFTVFRQSEVTATIGSAAIERGRGVSWRGGEQLSLGNGTALRLEVSGDPAPIRPKAAGPSVQLPEIPDLPDEEETVEQTDSSDAESSKVKTPAEELKPRSSKTAQILVILACLGMGMLIVAKKLKDDRAQEPAATNEITLESLFQRIDERAQEEVDARAGPDLAQLRDSLRLAYRLDQSGNAEAANDEYLRVLRMVRANSDNPPSTDDDPAASEMNESTLPQLQDPLFRDIFQFVSTRLSTQ